MLSYKFWQLGLAQFRCTPAARFSDGTPVLAQDAGLAAWTKVHQVLSHPRCANCHVGPDNVPIWYEPQAQVPPRAHGMNIDAGPSRVGAETLPCGTCRTAHNTTVPHGAPGAPAWHLPPVQQQWSGKSSAEICAQIKDPARNGGRTLAQIADHIANERLVAWGWAPGPFDIPAGSTTVEFTLEPNEGGTRLHMSHPGLPETPEIAEARGVPVGVDCISPARHSAFSTPIEMVQFIERLRQLSGGKPVGFKFCVGHAWEWFAMAKAMRETGIWPDFIVVDGAEGGTGAAPLEFTDHVGAPLQEGLLLVHNTLVGMGERHRVKIGCAGKVISAFDIARMMALGADWCNSARGFMFALGCIQAQSCHTGHCPTGVTSQEPLRARALVVPDKAERVYRYHHNTLHALKELVQAAGLHHPNDITADHIVRRVSGFEVRRLSNLLPYLQPGELLAAERGEAPWSQPAFAQYWPRARADAFGLAD